MVTWTKKKNENAIKGHRHEYDDCRDIVGIDKKSDSL